MFNTGVQPTKRNIAGANQESERAVEVVDSTIKDEGLRVKTPVWN
jgi:hypothetical protein